MLTKPRFGHTFGWLLAVAFLISSTAAKSDEPERLTAAGKPAEGTLDAFLGDSLFESQVIFEGGNDVREPYLAIAVDGTLNILGTASRSVALCRTAAVTNEATA